MRSFAPPLIGLIANERWNWAPRINRGEHELAQRPELYRKYKSLIV